MKWKVRVAKRWKKGLLPSPSPSFTPPDGYSSNLNEVYEWHAEHGIKASRPSNL